MKHKEKIEARRMRAEQGLPIREIAEKLQVAKSSVSLWVRDIELTDDQKKHLQNLNPVYNNQCKGAKARKEEALKKRQEWHFLGREDGQKKDLLHAMGCMLYWAEGTKSRNRLTFGNTDPNMLQLFKKFLALYGLENKDITIRINCHLNNGLTVEQIEHYWLKELDLPKSCLRKTTINRLSHRSSGFKKNKHPYGVCSIVVHSTEIVQRIYGAICEYADIAGEKWTE